MTVEQVEEASQRLKDQRLKEIIVDAIKESGLPVSLPPDVPIDDCTESRLRWNVLYPGGTETARLVVETLVEYTQVIQAWEARYWITCEPNNNLDLYKWGKVVSDKSRMSSTSRDAVVARINASLHRDYNARWIDLRLFRKQLIRLKELTVLNNMIAKELPRETLYAQTEEEKG